jgi:hypothetical protein
VNPAASCPKAALSQGSCIRRYRPPLSSWWCCRTTWSPTRACCATCTARAMWAWPSGEDDLREPRAWRCGRAWRSATVGVVASAHLPAAGRDRAATVERDRRTRRPPKHQTGPSLRWRAGPFNQGNRCSRRHRTKIKVYSWRDKRRKAAPCPADCGSVSFSRRGSTAFRFLRGQVESLREPKG